VEGESELEVRFDIRKARAEDADAIVEVLDHVPFLKDRYRGEAGISLVENNLEMIWLADLNGRVASVMIVQHKHDFGRLEISLIVTKPEFRRRDFARGLIHKAKRIAADNEVELVAYAENDISRDLFISEQFSLVPGVQSVEGHPMYRFSGTRIEPR
jgi:ribosomal protein S18 acetylase RimI-like enzyme